MSSSPVIETQRLILRKPEPRDVDASVAFLMSERGRFLVSGPMTAGKAWRAFASIIGHWDMRGYGLFAIELKKSGEVIGQAGPWFPGDWPEPEMSWAIWADEAEGKGYAYEAAEAALAHMRKSWEILYPVSYIDVKNTRSIRLAERLGAVIDPAAEDPFKEEEGDGYIYRHQSADQIGGDGGMEAYV